ncbi:PAS domain S-box protein [Roseofilum sp. BLCC_M143]|uniref:PAS domain S-box protein n=2 Tax=Roseofilum TaxID=1233426 RepID=A0ABT7C1N3_9CYAN|nr:PAS domain S-box protein [Roseofilum casamattae BLCC-M143]
MVLTLPWIAQILAVVGLVGYLSFRNGQKVVNDLALQLRSELTARIEQKLQSYLETPHNINRLNANALAAGELDPTTALRAPQLLQQMKITPFVNSVYCGTNRGDFLSVSRSDEDEGTLELLTSNRETDYIMSRYRIDSRGDRTYFIAPLSYYDPRLRPWYRGAIAKGVPVWSKVYLDFSNGMPTVTASVPVYSEWGNAILGVCATDVLLSEDLGEFLQQLTIGKTGQAFIIENTGNFISSSTNEPLAIGPEDHRQHQQATESENQLVRQTTEYLLQRFTTLENIRTQQQLNVTLNGERHFIQVVPLRDRGLEWLIILVIPESDFMEQIHTNTRTTIILCGLALLGAVGLGVITTSWIGQPVLNLSQASTEIASGQLEQNLALRGIRELDTMAASFNTMAKKLQESFSALEIQNIDLHQAKNALAETNDQLEAVLDAIPGAVSWMNAEGIYLGVNQHLAHNLDLPPEEMIGKPVGYFGKSPEYSQFIYNFLHSDRDGDLQILPIPIRGEIHYYLMAVQKYHRRTSTVAIGFDITERRQAQQALQIIEQNYSSLVENALEGIFQATPNGKYLSVNPAFAAIYGYESCAEAMAGVNRSNLEQYLEPNTWHMAQTQLAEVGEIKHWEYQVYRQDGSIIWVEEHTRRVRNLDGEVLYDEGIVQDITYRKQEEEKLKQQLAELRIEIDRQTLQREVTKITQADYFQQLKAEIAQIDVDRFWDS